MNTKEMTVAITAICAVLIFVVSLIAAITWYNVEMQERLQTMCSQGQFPVYDKNTENYKCERTS